MPHEHPPHELEPLPVTDSDRGFGERTPPAGTPEHLLQVGLIVLLAVWSFQVVRPFLLTVAWGIIIAVTLAPAYERLEIALNRRRALAAAITTLLALALLVVPAVLLSDTLVTSVEHFSHRLDEDGIRIPPPPEVIGNLPVVGHWLEERWLKASQAPEEVRSALARHLKPVAAWLVTAAAGMTVALAQFVVAIVVAGFLLMRAPEVIEWSDRIVRRVAADKGTKLVALAKVTIRNVSRGVLGVALIQTLCAGVAFLLVGLPAAGLWALLCFFLAVVQVGTLPIVAPAAIYVFFTADLWIAIPFAIWCGFVGLIDNVLKPLLLHRGLPAPLWVVVVGSIGGILSSGVIGLFTGPVVLVLGYALLRAWLDEDGEHPAPEPTDREDRQTGA
jgi:predicted PurR-regulated permease PerM